MNLLRFIPNHTNIEIKKIRLSGYQYLGREYLLEIIFLFHIPFDFISDNSFAVFKIL